MRKIAIWILGTRKNNIKKGRAHVRFADLNFASPDGKLRIDIDVKFADSRKEVEIFTTSWCIRCRIFKANTRSAERSCRRGLQPSSQPSES